MYKIKNTTSKRGNMQEFREGENICLELLCDDEKIFRDDLKEITYVICCDRE